MSAVDLERFIRAQEEGEAYIRALAQLRSGRKSGHWIWFIFPQASGLGRSATSRRYAITSLAEARAYLEHPVLGARLLEATQALTGDADSTIEEILGPVDAIKLRSSMTLFMAARPQEPSFAAVIDRYFDGEPDARTLEWLVSHP